MVFDLIENNFVAVVITVFLMLFILTNNNFEKRINRLFLAAAICILVLIGEENWETQLALRESPVMMRTVLSAIGYSLRPMIPYFLIIVMSNYSKKQFAFVSAPLVVNALVTFSALFCKWSFSYTPTNEFARGPLGITPFLVAAFYVILLLAKTTQDWKRGSIREVLIVTAIVLLAFISTVLESQFGFRFIQNPSMATSITFYYMFLHSMQNNRDPLTGALTRRRFFLDAEKYRSTLTAVISLDINDLKILNDQHGHIEGDRALVTVTDVIKKYTRANISLYRTGGDEFMILCSKMTEQDVQDVINNIRIDLKKTKYRCAIGYAAYSPQTKFDSVCQLADVRMYEDKRRVKMQGAFEVP